MLLRAWNLILEDPTDENCAEAEALIGPLAAAGYVDDEGDRWGFTPKGIARAEELEGELGGNDGRTAPGR